MWKGSRLMKSIVTDDVCFTRQAWEDYLHWQESDPAQLERINALLRDIRTSPFTGLGKPEPLKGNLSGWWSRRIDREHRLVYRLVDMGVTSKGKSTTQPTRFLQVAACRFHY